MMERKKRKSNKTLNLWLKIRNMNKRTLFKMILVIALYLISYILYHISLGHETLRDFLENKKAVVIQVIFSLIFNVVATNLIVILGFSLLQRLLLLVYFGINFILIWKRDQQRADGDEFHYGYWVSRGYLWLFLAFLVLTFCVLIIVKLIAKFKIRKKIVFCVICTVIAVAIIRFAYSYSIRRSTFDKGLFGEKYRGDLSYCRVSNDVYLVSRMYPKFTFHYIFLSHWCSRDEEFVDLLDNDDPKGKITTIRINKKKVGSHMTCDLELFPNIKDYYRYSELRNYKKDTPHWTVTVLQKHFLKKIEYRRNIKIGEKITYDAIKYETALVRCGTRGNIVVNPKRKYDHRKLLDVSVETPNIMLLWFDSESRKAFEYDFPESTRYLQRTILKSKEYDFYQFFGHQVIGWNTYPQFLTMFNGILEQNRSTILWEEARKAGYLTIYSDDECNEASSRYNKNPYGNDNPIVFDYTHLEPYCLPEYTDPVDHFSVFKGPLAVGRRCLFQYEGPQYIFEYFKKIETIYPEKAKFYYAMFDEAHEGTGEAQRYIDRYFRDYLEFLHKSGALKKTLLFMFADHGNHMSIVLNMFREGKIGGMNPMLYLLSPKGTFDAKQKKNLEINKHRIVTAYDLHKTWMGLLNRQSDWNNLGLNFVDTEIPYERTCKDASIPRCYTLQCGGKVCGKDSC